MNIERIRQVKAHLQEAEDISAKLHKYPDSEHAAGWREDMQAELGEARRLMLLGDKPDNQTRLMLAAA